jgi:glycine/D-amino acid oxidase-like deaminating enzyme
MTADVVVAGAGIVGAACAAALARRGLRVAVVEPGIVGGGATAAGMGHIVVMDDSEAQFALTRFSAFLWNALAPALPPVVEYEPRGTIWVAAGEDEMAAVRSKLACYNAGGVAAEALDAKALSEAEPNLRPGLAGGLRVPGDSVIYAPCAAAWLLRQARVEPVAAGVAAIRNDGVDLDDGSRIEAGAVVCASGTWATALFPSLALRPRKGHLAITDRYPGFVRHQLVELGYLKSAHGHASESVAFNAQPRATGQVLIGSSRQYSAAHADIDRPMLARMLARAVEYMPALAQLSVVRAWTGLRAATPDSLPIVGPCPGRDRVFLATGHEGLGITTALGTAEIVAAMILGSPPPIDPSPYLPSRMLAHG